MEASVQQNIDAWCLLFRMSGVSTTSVIRKKQGCQWTIVPKEKRTQLSKRGFLTSKKDIFSTSFNDIFQWRSKFFLFSFTTGEHDFQNKLTLVENVDVSTKWSTLGVVSNWFLNARLVHEKKSVLNFWSLVCQFKDFMQKGYNSSKIKSKRGHFAKNGVL